MLGLYQLKIRLANPHPLPVELPEMAFLQHLALFFCTE